MAVFRRFLRLFCGAFFALGAVFLTNYAAVAALYCPPEQYNSSYRGNCTDPCPEKWPCVLYGSGRIGCGSVNESSMPSTINYCVANSAVYAGKQYSSQSNGSSVTYNNNSYSIYDRAYETISNPATATDITVITCKPGGYCPGYDGGGESGWLGATKTTYPKSGRILCPPGTYNPNSGSKTTSDCVTCPANSYTATYGNAACSSCASGYTTNEATDNMGDRYREYHDQQSDCSGTVTLDFNGGTTHVSGAITTDLQAVTKNCSQGVTCVFGATNTEYNTPPSGYSYIGGWGTSSNCTSTTTSFVTPTGTYYACKTLTNHTIALTSNGAQTTGTTTLYAKYDSGVYKDSARTSQMMSTASNPITKPTRTGYTFNGYTTQRKLQTSGNAIGFETLTVINSNGYITNDGINIGKKLTSDITTTTPMGQMAAIDPRWVAQWTPITYTISFNANGGSGSASPTSISCVFDSYCTSSDRGTLTKPGYTFNGWNTESDGTGTHYDANEDVLYNLTATSGATVPLYAEWAALPSDIITLDKNGGTGGDSYLYALNNSEVYFDSDFEDLYFDWDDENTTGPISIPTKNGYTFAGYKDHNGYLMIDDEGWPAQYTYDVAGHGELITETWTAQWTPDVYTVTLDSNGGTIPSGGTTSVSATYGAGMPSPITNPIRTGYDFTGYYDATSGGTKYYNADGTSARNWDKTENTTLYAQWEIKKYVIYLDKTGETNPSACNDDILYGTYGVADVYIKSTRLIGLGLYPTTASHNSICLPERTDWVPLGYYDSQVGGSKCIGTDGQLTTEGSQIARIYETDQTWYIHWGKQCAAGTYFRASDATCAPCPNGSYCSGGIFEEFGGDQGISACPDGSTGSDNGRDAITDCFYVCPDTITVEHASSVAPVNAKIYLTKNSYNVYTYSNCTYNVVCDSGYYPSAQNVSSPVCSVVRYTVTLNANGGSGGTTSVSVTYNSPMPTLTALPSRSQYGFTGYYDATSGGTKYYNADGTSARNWDKTENTILYAQWDNTSLITLDPNGGTIPEGGTTSVVATYNVGMPSINTAKLPTRAAPSSDTNYRFYGYWDSPTYLYGTRYYTAEGASARTWDKETIAQTLYAQWRPEYIITLDPNGGVIPEGGITEVFAEQTYGTYNQNPVTIPVLTGHTFTGYYDAQTGGKRYFNDRGQSSYGWDKTSGATLYAQWTPSTYTVTYLCGTGATGNAPANGTATYNADFTPANNTCAKTGYAFVGWNDGTTDRPAGTAFTWTYTSDKTFTAQWVVQTSNVTLNANNGTMPSDGTTSVTATYGEEMPEIDTTKLPIRTGYTFNGYYDRFSENTETQYYTADGVSARTWDKTGAQTLYAHWNSNTYTVTLDDATNGGSGGMGTIKEVYGQKWTDIDGNTITSVTIPSHQNGVFLGYYDGDGNQRISYDGSIKNSASPKQISADTTWYAKFGNCACSTDSTVSSCESIESDDPNRCKYTYTCNDYYHTENGEQSGTFYGNVNAQQNSVPACIPNEYTITLDNANATTNGTDTLYTIYHRLIVYLDSARTINATTNPITKPQRSGYAIVSYNTNGGSLSVNLTDKNVKANYIFDGYYSDITGGTQYINEDGQVISDGKSAAAYYTSNDNVWHAQWRSSSVTTPAATRTGYTFDGWYDAQNGGNCVARCGNTSKYAPTADNITLYAHWTQTPYTISFNDNGGTGGQSEPLTAAFGAAMPTPITLPTRTGYTFTGYSNNGTKYYNADGTSAHDWDKIQNTILYAQWTANQYTVETDLNDGSAITTTNVTYNNSFSKYNPARNGYTFAGWDITGMDDTEHTIGSSTTNETSVSGIMATSFKNLRATSGTVRFTAQWTPITYTITYKTYRYGEEITGLTPTTYTTGSTINLPTNVNVADHVFSGYWYDGSGNEINQITPEMYGDKVLYAKWTSITCPAGYYVSARNNNNGNKCEECYGSYYCPGDTFTISDVEQGKIECPTTTNVQEGAYITSGEASGTIKWLSGDPNIADTAEDCVTTLVYGRNSILAFYDGDTTQMSSNYNPDLDANIGNALSTSTCAYNSTTDAYTNCFTLVPRETGIFDMINCYKGYYIPQSDIDDMLQINDAISQCDNLQDDTAKTLCQQNVIQSIKTYMGAPYACTLGEAGYYTTTYDDVMASNDIGATEKELYSNFGVMWYYGAIMNTSTMTETMNVSDVYKSCSVETNGAYPHSQPGSWTKKQCYATISFNSNGGNAIDDINYYYHDTNALCTSLIEYASNNDLLSFATKQQDGNNCYAEIEGTTQNNTTDCNDAVFNDIGDGDWKMQWSYGTIKGTSLCSSTPGNQADVGNPTTESGNYCWCKITDFVDSNENSLNITSDKWVVIDMDSQCSKMCSAYCPIAVYQQQSIRNALYGQTDEVCTVEELPTPTREGYAFDGWYANSGLTGNRLENSDDLPGGDQTLYARWTSNATCSANQIDTADGCKDVGFTITTTNMSANDTFTWSMSAAGTFYVDCGDGGTLSSDANDVVGNKIDRTNNTTLAQYTCTYSTAGVKTIRFGGVADGYNSTPNMFYNYSAIVFGNGYNTPEKIAAISGSLGAVFPTLDDGSDLSEQPRFIDTFSGCTGLTSLPVDSNNRSTLFNGVTGNAINMFKATFDNCTGLTSLPNGLFATVSGSAEEMFYDTFSGCSGLTSLPTDLFNTITGAAQEMFTYTFKDCTGLTSLPVDSNNKSTLFKNVAGSAQNMFFRTFDGCTGLTSLPSDLFAGVNAAEYELFGGTFAGCTGLTSIPSDLFVGVSGAAYGTFDSTFDGCTGLTSVPSGLFRNVSGVAMGMFGATFANCTSLTTVPADLFSSVSGAAAATFLGTFAGDTSLDTFDWGNGKTTSYIPPQFFENAVVDSNAGMFMTNVFYDTDIATECPSGTTQYITGFEDYWNYGSDHGGQKVSCEPITCTANQIDTVDGCQDAKFTLTTTEMTANDTFKWGMSASGTFYVDCGDNGVLSSTANDVTNGNTITRSDTTVAQYTCTYPTGGTHTIRMGGSANGYNTTDSGFGQYAAIGFSADNYSGNTPTKIAGISGSLGAIFGTIGNGGTFATQPRFITTFSGATNMTGSIPSNLFTGITGAPVNYMFAYTFNSCNGLSGQIPATLFAGIHGAPAQNMFDQTFNGCSGLTGSIPSTLFCHDTNNPNADNCIYGAPAIAMFRGTFNSCNGLSGQIPATLFAGIHGAPAQSMFFQTFLNCSGLTGTIPSTLFCQDTNNPNANNCIYGAPNISMFSDTFSGCSGLSGQIPATLFAGIHGAPASYMFGHTFNGCSNLSGQIPATLFAGIHGAPARAMFDGTFLDCSGLTGEIPSTLFCQDTNNPNANNCIYGAPAQDMFGYTFSGCSGLTGFTNGTTTTNYVPSTFLASINTNTSVSYQASSMFTGTGLLLTCPAGTYDVTREQFNNAGRPWCSPCPDGTTSPAGSTSIDQCVVPSYNITYMDGGVELTGLTPATYNAGVGATINAQPTKEHGSFVAWCTDAGLTNCALPQTIATTDTGDKTYWAKFTCNTGYTYNPGDIASKIGNVDGASYAYIDNSGSFSEYGANQGQNSYGITDNNAFAVKYLNGAKIKGHTACDYVDNTSNVATWGQDWSSNWTPSVYNIIDSNFVDSFPGSNYSKGICYCRLEEYTNGTEQQSLSSPWVFYANLINVGSDSHCNWACPKYCAEAMYNNGVSGFMAFRSAMLNAVSASPASASSCDINTYTITYNLNGGTNYDNAPTSYTVESETITLGAPTKNGYMFGGWFAESTFDTRITEIQNGSTGDVTLYAQWTPISYTITYNNMDDATNYDNAPETYNIESATITLGAPTKNGYMFGGWFAESTFDTRITEIQNGSTGDVTLYAKWIESCANEVYPAYDGNAYICDDSYKFWLETTEDTERFVFELDAAGEFVVNWGDGNVETITNSNTLSGHVYSHNYAEPGSYNIGFKSINVTEYPGGNTSTIRFGNQWWTTDAATVTNEAVYRIHGTFGQLLPILEDSTDLTKRPRFGVTFAQCYNLEGLIPANLFTGSVGTVPVHAMFPGTFAKCSKLSGQIPAGLFGAPTGQYATHAFEDTFLDDPMLTGSIPAGLFGTMYGTPQNNMFSSTFEGCSGLTGKIPENLFGNPSGTLPSSSTAFINSFTGCSGLDGFVNATTGTTYDYIPQSFFGNLDDTGYTSGPMKNIFAGTSIAETCPDNMYVSDTAFRVDFNAIKNVTSGSRYKVMCVPCPNGYVSVSGENSTINQCYTTCPLNDSLGGTYVSELGGYAYYGVDGDDISTCKYAYTITYNNMDDATNYDNAPTSYVYGTGATIDGIPTRDGYFFDGWCTDEELENCAYTQTIGTDATGNKEFWAKWEPVKFTLTTTEMTANDTFTWTMSASGTFTVDCGDNGVLSGTGVSGNTITRSNTTRAQYTCTYPTTGTHTIRMGGSANGYNATDGSSSLYAAIGFSIQNYSNNTPAKIAGISGSLGAIFGTIGNGDTLATQPRFTETFYNATNMAGSIPSNLFTGITGAPAINMFFSTFSGCSNLSGQIPATLFAGIHGAPAQNMFYSTFSNCSGLTGTIPSTLFCQDTNNPNANNCIYGAPAKNMFGGTFYGCSNLSGQIPATLFAGIHGAPAQYMFGATFYNCSGLTGTIPSTLFCQDTNNPNANNCIYGAPASSMFSSTFQGCNNLSGQIPATLFAGIHGAPAEGMFSATFSGCRGLTGTIPTTLFCQDTNNPNANNCIYGAPASYMFANTFQNCSGLNGFTDGTTTTSYVPGTFLNTIDTNTSVSNQTTNMFNGTGLASTCPAGTYTTTRQQFNSASKPWCTPCPSGYTSTEGENSTINQCYTTCPLNDSLGGTYVSELGGYAYYGVDGDDISTCKYAYTITYHDGEEIVSLSPSTYTYGVGATIDATLAWEGWTFDGWYDNSELTGDAITAIPTDAIGNIDLYAKWHVNTYTVTLDKNANDAMPGTTSVTVTYGENMPTINAPERNGYDFIGYYDTQESTDGTKYYDPVYRGALVRATSAHVWDKTSGATLYAHWTPRSGEIKLKHNDGTDDFENIYTIFDTGVYKDSDHTLEMTTVVNPVTPLTRNGFTFDGYVQYVSHSIEPGNSGSTQDFYVATPEDLALPRLIDANGFITADGLALGKTVYEPRTNNIINLPSVWKAVWIPIGYNIQYVLCPDGSANCIANASNDSRNPSTYNTTQNVTLYDASRTGYTFAGWYDNPELTGDVITSIPPNSIGPKTFYASWTPKQYTISYRCFDNGDVVHADSLMYGDSYEFVSNTDDHRICQRPGWIFAGWTCSYVDENSESHNISTNPVSKWYWAYDVSCVPSPWDETYFNVSFNANSMYVENPEAMSSISCPYSTGCVMPESLYVRNGYLFDGWKSNEDDVYNIGDTIKEQLSDVTMYAQWKPQDNIQCVAGTYLKAGDFDKCTNCPVGFYCPGFESGEYVYNAAKDQGIRSCRVDFGSTTPSVTTDSKCEDSEEIGGCAKSLSDCYVPCDTTYGNYVIDSENNKIRYGQIASDVCLYKADIEYKGAENCDTQTYLFADRTSVPLCVPNEVLGRTFIGWTDNKGNKYTDISANNNERQIDDNVPESGVVTMTANWDIEQYIISYDCGNGNNIVVGDMEYDDDVELLDYARCDNPGYTLTKWNCGDDFADNNKMPNHDVECVAETTVNTYNIEFNGNGADSGNMDTIENISYIAEQQLSENTYERSGYDFVGWCDNNTCSDHVYDDKEIVSKLTPDNDATVVLYAKWEAIPYTISYTIPYGITVANKTTYSKETPTFTLNNPSEPGYKFNAWCTNAELTENCELTKTIEQGSTIGNLAFFASMEPIEYTITYKFKDIDGVVHDISDMFENRYTKRTVGQSVSYPKKADVHIPNYNFVAWYNNSNLSGASVNGVAASVTSNMTAWAKVTTLSCGVNQYIEEGACKDCPAHSSSDGALATECVCDMGYYKDGDNCISNTITLDWNENGGSQIDNGVCDYDADLVLPDAPVRNGYVFAGWKLADGTIKNATETVAAGCVENYIGVTSGDSNVIAAQWNVQKYTIKYNSNGGTTYPQKQYTVNSADIMLPQNAVRNGYEFGGWYANEDLSGSVVDMVAHGSTGNKEFWAKWNVINYEISYNNDGGEFKSGYVPITTYNMNSDTIALPTSDDIVRDNYVFVGWVDENNNIVTEIQSGSSGNKELTAQWTHESCEQNQFWNTNSDMCEACPAHSTSAGGMVTQCNCDNHYVMNNNTCVPKSYTITYYYNGGALAEGLTNPQTYNIEMPETVLYVPEKTDYTFNGWHLNSVNGAIITNISGDMIAYKNIRLYATWTKNPDTRTITFDCDTDKIIERAGFVGTSVYVPTTEECEISTGDITGWTCNGQTYTDTMIIQSNNITCTPVISYANVEYNIIYKGYDTDGNEIDLSFLGPTTYTASNGIRLPTKNQINVPGYNFERWYLKYNNSVFSSSITGYAANADIRGAKTFYAKFTAVTVHCDPGYYLPANSTECALCEESGMYCPGGDFVYSDTIDSINTCDENYPLSDSGAQSMDDCYKQCDEREHYTVAGHQYSDGINDCVYTPVTYYIYYNTNGGNTVAPTEYNVEMGVITELPIPEKDDKDFDGWFDINDNEIAGIDTSLGTDITLYAHWKYKACDGNQYRLDGLCTACPANSHAAEDGVSECLCDSGYIKEADNCQLVEYYITYVGLKGTTHSNPLTYTVEDADLQFSAPSDRIGYEFTGWTKDGEEFTTIPSGMLGDITLTANWKAKTIHCEPGYYYPGNSETCTQCVEENIYCPGGDYTYSDTPNGKENCPVEHPYSTDGISCYNSCVDPNVSGAIYADGRDTCDYTYPIEYNLDGGEFNTVYPETYEHGVGILPLATPAKPGYGFYGWYDNPEKQGNPVTSIDTNRYGAVELWAKWGFVCESGKWLHLGDGGDRLCLYTEKPAGTVMVLETRDKPTYIMLTEDEDVTVHKGSSKKLRVAIGNKVYNAYDASVNMD